LVVRRVGRRGGRVVRRRRHRATGGMRVCCPCRWATSGVWAACRSLVPAAGAVRVHRWHIGRGRAPLPHECRRRGGVLVGVPVVAAAATTATATATATAAAAASAAKGRGLALALGLGRAGGGKESPCLHTCACKAVEEGSRRSQLVSMGVRLRVCMCVRVRARVHTRFGTGRERESRGGGVPCLCELLPRVKCVHPRHPHPLSALSWRQCTQRTSTADAAGLVGPCKQAEVEAAQVASQRTQRQTQARATGAVRRPHGNEHSNGAQAGCTSARART
jgi:hypothetical protein